ncbi:hypothetical protein YERSI8AC_180002 [Enterobacterales bacterium 8AC]|jgi:hypothetical protein|nr:hypothetical protein YERSI8AC_180002 [Enterobacterales bacterium 8AC]
MLLSINESGIDAIYTHRGISNTPIFVSVLVPYLLNRMTDITPIIMESTLYNAVDLISLNVIDVNIDA